MGNTSGYISLISLREFSIIYEENRFSFFMDRPEVITFNGYFRNNSLSDIKKCCKGSTASE